MSKVNKNAKVVNVKNTFNLEMIEDMNTLSPAAYCLQSSLDKQRTSIHGYLSNFVEQVLESKGIDQPEQYTLQLPEDVVDPVASINNVNLFTRLLGHVNWLTNLDTFLNNYISKVVILNGKGNRAVKATNAFKEFLEVTHERVTNSLKYANELFKMSKESSERKDAEKELNVNYTNILNLFRKENEMRKAKEVANKKAETKVTNENKKAETSNKELEVVEEIKVTKKPESVEVEVTIPKKETKKVDEKKEDKKEEPKKSSDDTNDTLKKLAEGATKEGINRLLSPTYRMIGNTFEDVNSHEGIKCDDTVDAETFFKAKFDLLKKSEVELTDIGTMFKNSGMHFELVYSHFDEIKEGFSDQKLLKEVRNDIDNAKKQFDKVEGRIAKLMGTTTEELRNATPEESKSIIGKFLDGVWNIICKIGRFVKLLMLKIIDLLFNWDYDQFAGEDEKAKA